MPCRAVSSVGSKTRRHTGGNNLYVPRESAGSSSRSLNF
jgi:hypothetical protein